LDELRRRRGETLSAREEARREALVAGRSDLVSPGIDAVPLGEVFDFDERAESFVPAPALFAPGSAPRAVLRSLGITHLLVVERRPTAGGGSLLSSLTAGKSPIWVIDPGSDSGTREAFLPTEMDFPLVGLWTVSRPGPRLALYDLPLEVER
jgi:hypothetical protein